MGYYNSDPIGDSERYTLDTLKSYENDTATVGKDEGFFSKAGSYIKGVGDKVAEEANEWGAAPLDKLADLSRSPVGQILAQAGGPTGALIQAGIQTVDNVADYTQGESDVRDSTFSQIRDMVGTFGGPGMAAIYDLSTDPEKAVKTFNANFQDDNPMFGSAMSFMFGGGNDVSQQATGDALQAARQKADATQSQMTQGRSDASRDTIMGADASTPPWKKLQQEFMSKPNYGDSILSNIRNF